VARARFGTAINCIDGRTQLPVIAWLREVQSVDYVDLVTQPGADGILATDPARAEELIRPRVEVSVQGHASPVVAVVGHHECLANPVDEAVHRAHLEQACAAVQAWGLGVDVIALWVNQDWQVEVLETRGA
jgi:hypothetical protein